MDTPEIDPGNGGFPATQEVAELITAVSLPRIERFSPRTPGLAGLPRFTPVPVPTPEPASQVSVARAVQSSTVAALAAVKVLEDRVAALKAALVARHVAAVEVEATALALDSWQGGICGSSGVAEIAATLCIPEGTAKALAGHATALLDQHPATFAALDAGVLSWRHACVLVDESRTLAETPSTTPAALAEFEALLLKAAPGLTGSRFAARARRLREGTHPETLPTRMRQAIGKRSLFLEPGKDGMAWLTLHLPAPAAQGAFVHCTRQARSLQGPNEHRTLDQLRADAATLLLLGQAFPHGATQGGYEVTDGAEVIGGMEVVGGIVGGNIVGAEDLTLAQVIAILSGAADPSSGRIDGIAEDPMGDYLSQLDSLRDGASVTEPPLPTAQVIVTVPVLGLLGATNQPAQLAGHGPIPEEIARKLLNNAGTFLRVLTDPVTNLPLDGAAPERYRLRAAEKTLLRALNETCSFPNCTNPALDTETDHRTPYAHGGATTLENSNTLCRRHHNYKHFRDDKDKYGRFRQDLDPDRAGIKLRGWKPARTSSGEIGWTSPTGVFHRPPPRSTEPPAYPRWIKKQFTQTLATKSGLADAWPSTGDEERSGNTITGGTITTNPIDLQRGPFEQLLRYAAPPRTNKGS